MSNFLEKVEAIEQADGEGDQLQALKAQKALLLSLLKETDVDMRDKIQLVTAINRTSIEIVKLEGLVRAFDEQQQKEVDREDAFRKIFGKDGVGLNE